MLTDKRCDFSLWYWLPCDKFSYTKTLPAQSLGAPLGAQECWGTAAWVRRFNSSSHAGHSTAALREGRFYQGSPMHTTSYCCPPCLWLGHRIKPKAAYLCVLQFFFLPSFPKFLYWGLTLTTYVGSQLYMLYSNVGHSIRIRWAGKT